MILQESKMVPMTNAMAREGVFAIERQGDIVIVMPVGNLREADYQTIETAAHKVLAYLDRTQARHVIVDLERMDYGGSTALKCFIRFSRNVMARGGRIAFCNISQHERDILHVTHLDHAWHLCASRTEAFDAVRNQHPGEQP